MRFIIGLGLNKLAWGGLLLSLVFAALSAGAVENAHVGQQVYQAAEVFSTQLASKAAPTQSSAKPQCLALHGHCWAWTSPELTQHILVRATVRFVSPDRSLPGLLISPEPPPPRLSVLI